MKAKNIILPVLSGLVWLTGCKKFIDIDAPITSASSSSVYTSNAKAAAVLTGIYGRMVGSATTFATGRQGITVAGGLSADEFETYTTVGVFHTALYTNSDAVNVTNIWQEMYQQIYVTNAAIEGLGKSTGVTDSIKRRLTGEARFMRAFLYFYLVNLWGDVPLLTTTDYYANQLASRTSSVTVYAQIIEDLEEARNLLSDNYTTAIGAATTERVRPNKAVATALLARVYLYQGEWQKAETLSTEVISSTPYSLVSSPGNIFLANSTEAIWQIPPVTVGVNTYEGNAFIRTTAPSSVEPVSVSSYILSAFEPGDLRKTNWVDSTTISAKKYYYPKKYKIKGGGTSPVTPTEYLMVLRLAEQYLIRAEAEARQDKVTEARNDLLALRRRAGLADATLTANDQASLLTAVAHERQVELFSEWGHRWLDLKRTGALDALMAVICPVKGGSWNPDHKLYPIPQSEILNDPNLSQNPGYN